MMLNVMWFRRDLRLNDNAALYHALKGENRVLPIFIFDKNILDKLEDADDARVTFIYDTLTALKETLTQLGSTLHVYYDTPTRVFQHLAKRYEVGSVYTNHDYEHYAHVRDAEIRTLLEEKNIQFHTFKDTVIFENTEVTKDNGAPYTVFTPYSKKWKEKLNSHLIKYNDEQISFYLQPYPTEKYFHNFVKTENSWEVHPLSNPTENSGNLDKIDIPTLENMGFSRTHIKIPPMIIARSIVKNYDKTRDFPALSEGITRLGVHFRFGTISIREKALAALYLNETYLNELIWRDFYVQILQNFPHISEGKAFRPEYDRIEWRNNEAEFKHWCNGTTGYPLVDAGMRELNATGYMHNRVRMVVASFLTKHLLIDWRWGEAYFARKLLDFDLASNNGGWQWAAGSGTDAAPYFRIFSPEAQREKFDKNNEYIKKWVPEFGTFQYTRPIVDHNAARQRCLAVYKAALVREV